MRQKKVKLMDLVIDPGIKVREVNSVVQARYSEAYKSGAVFPPIMIDSKNRIVSGHHRHAMYRVNCESETLIDCLVTPATKDSDLLMLALEENTKHGEPLRTIEKQEATLRLVKQYKINPEKVAEIIGVRIDRINEWAGMYVVTIGANGKKHERPVKRNFEHMVGQVVSNEDYDSHRQHDYGVSLKTLSNQIIAILKRSDIWVKDVSTLIQLKQELDKFLKDKSKIAG